MNIDDVKNIKKNSYDFSFTQEMLNEVNNLDFAVGEVDYLNSADNNAVDTRRSYLWSSLSAITEDVGEAIYQNILNYIDNVCDVDTCSVKALQSMIQILGTKFSIFDSLKNCPVEILNLIDIFSIRKDYLINSEKICSKLVSELSSLDTEWNHSENGILSSCNETDPLSVYPPFIIAEKLDDVVCSAFGEVLSAHVFQTYNDLSSTSIVKDQYQNIKQNSFELSSEYDQTIDEYKTRWNISPSFDESIEVDKIENGVSSITDYTLRQQNVLSIEIRKRQAAKNELEPTTRYAYYHQRDVRDYIKFIEQLYGDNTKAYVNSKPYTIDSKYIEIKSLSSAEQLITGETNDRASGVNINEKMLEDVKKLLVNIVDQIRGIREYLKSHAQRTYMKGTFLLIAYIINEYLNNNTIPTLKKLDYLDQEVDYSQNTVKLIEYVDQTQYNNLQTDIKEDADNRDVNPAFWEGTAANGNANELDTTNIFRPADKLKLVTSPSFAYREIEKFYLDVLNNVTGQSRLKAQDRDIYSFLSAVFAVGADNTYQNSNGKIMCELPNTVVTTDPVEWNAQRKFTIDIDNYISDISAAYDSSNYILSSFSPIQNSSIQYQLIDALDDYKQKAQDAFMQQLDEVNNDVTIKLQNITTALEKLDAYYVVFQDYSAEFSNLVASCSQYIPNVNFVATTLRAKLLEFNSKYSSQLPGIVKDSVTSAIKALLDKLNALADKMIKEMSPYQILTKIQFVRVIFDFYELKCDIRTSPLNLQTTSLGSRFSALSKYVEQLYQQLYSYLENLQTELLQQQQTFYSTAQHAIVQAVNSYESTDFSTLSTKLHDYLDEQFLLTDCVKEISARLDYTNTDWYKYKSQLFQKYSGLSTSDLPFYYIENTRHPSYQIHPCLSNFIEAIDYQFPINGLVGLAESTIRDIVKNTAELCVNNGCILSAWNNPLNSNENYLTKYEKSNHIDEMSHVNRYYGHDGLYHPSITNVNILNFDTDSIDSPNSLFKGLDISYREHQKLYHIINELGLKTKYNNYINDSAHYQYHILKYGLDIYDNAYMLISNSSDAKYGTLWFRPKNYPISFPALVYKDSNSKYEFDEEHSQFEKSSSIENLETNAAFSKLEMQQLTGSYYVPLFADFTFSSTRKVILLNGIPSGTTDANSTYANSIPVHGFVVQKYDYDVNEDRFKRYLTPDTVEDSPFREVLSTDLSQTLKCVCPFFDGSNIGQIFAEYGSNNLTVDVIRYYANSNDIRYQSDEISAVVSLQNLAGLDDIKFSSKQNGQFSCAFLSSFDTNTQVKLYADKSTTYTYSSLTGQYPNYLQTAYGSLLGADKNSVKTLDFEVIGKSIQMSEQKLYAPVVDMGFIPLYSNATLRSQKIAENYYEQDFDRNGTLKFECLSPTYSNTTPAIDFKFICPIRVEDVEEESGIGHAESTVTFNSGIGAVSIYPITNIHNFDSYFNKYVISDIDAQYWDLTENERLATLTSDVDSEKIKVDTYKRLANYDVMKYLCAQKEESPYSMTEHGDRNRDDASVFNDDPSLELITEPCLISQDSYQSLAANHPYITGKFTSTSTPTVTTLRNSSYTVQLNLETTLSVIVRNVNAGVPSYKLDFNSEYYFKPPAGLENTRNHRHMFLNLDEPGDSGYLNIYDNYTNSGRCMMTLFIKNISDEIPKFVLRKVYSAEYAGEDARLIEIAVDKSKYLRASNSVEQTVTVLADETDRPQYIEFS